MIQRYRLLRYHLLRVFPRAKAARTPLGPKVPKADGATLAMRRTVPARWLDDAKWSSLTIVAIR